jgi:hypothetical protein
MTRIKNEVVIMLDTEAELPIQIGKTNPVPPQSMLDLYNTMNLDMATICEALSVLIKEAEKMGLKNKTKSLADCIKHITDGVNSEDGTSTVVKFGGLN